MDGQAFFYCRKIEVLNMALLRTQAYDTVQNLTCVEIQKNVARQLKKETYTSRAKQMHLRANVRLS